MTRDELPPELTGATTTLNVTFLEPAKLGGFTAVSELISRHDRDAAASGELRDEEGLLVATATATLRILPRRQKRS